MKKAILTMLVAVLVFGGVSCSSYRYESSEREEYTPKAGGGHIIERTRKGSGSGRVPPTYIIRDGGYNGGGGYQVYVTPAPSASQLRGLLPGGND